MRTLNLALKDIQQIVRDRKALLFIAVMPVLFTVFMGIMQSPPSSPSDLRLPIGFINQDSSGTLGTELRSLLQASDAVRPVDVAQNEVAQIADQVRDEKLAAVVTVPDRFGAQLLSNQPIKLSVIVDTNKPAGQTADTALRSASGRLMGAVEAARLSTADRPQNFEAALSAALQAWQQPPIGVTVEKMNTPKNEKVVAQGFNQSSPGMLVMFTLFGLTTTATVLVLERKAFTLQRMLTTSMNRAAIIAGHLLAMFAIVFFQEALLVIFAQLFLGVNYFREPVATLLVMLTFGACIAAFGLFLSATAKTEEQATMFALLAMFVFAALGGAWFPLDVTGQTFYTIGHLTPGAWAMDGFQNIVVRGLGLTSVLLPVGVLAAYALAFFGLAVWRFKFE